MGLTVAKVLAIAVAAFVTLIRGVASGGVVSAGVTLLVDAAWASLLGGG